ncbi:alpha-amylase [Paenibacillus sp. UNCCL117]|uniref:alpha-amylase n=1 Tax=unclassified Paenibacillus TaxID=185978 RepID=UPI00088D2745|nr:MULTISPECIES: alpha-amylase [unclassified Paenibacillus]SDD12275.1 alpha-amylase [Paenibacillus sp. cl123]SFW33759.1 alpha-amylase [Paenibacillus sp. UNCCL117]
MAHNHTMMQFFEWHVEADGSHWRRLKDLAPELKKQGIDSVWIPPVTKSYTQDDTGYSVYDLYDLGEFDQKGGVRTKYGTKEELHEAIAACKEQGLAVYVDVVMNHKAGADETETFQVIEVNGEDRTEEISEPFEIEGWTRFTFPGRDGRYSSFQWNFEHFNGTDYDAKEDRTGVFRIVGENKHWNQNVDHEFGNYDYLMFANIDYSNETVQKEMIAWGKWLANTLACDGFRLDAIKHINHEFIKAFAAEVVRERGDDFYIVGEFWNPELSACQRFLDTVDYRIDLFDVSLHYKLHEASRAGADFDLRTIFDDTLVQSHPSHAVTFVDNHDSQPHEALESWVEDGFKQSAYALILLRQGGYPCVFYGDYFGIGGEHPIEGKKIAIDPLLYARRYKAYGEQEDYFDHPNTIGWVRRGLPEIPRSGCAVVITNGDEGDKRMYVGEERAGEIWVDLTNTRDDRIEIEEDGFACFPVNAGSVSVWALPDEDVEPA